MSTAQWWQYVSAVLVGACLAVLVCLTVARIWPVLALFALGAVIAHLLDPVLDRLQRRGWSRLYSVWFVMLISTVAVAIFLAWAVPTVVSQVQSLARAWPTYAARANALYENVSGWLLARVENPETARRYSDFLDQQWTQLQSWVAENLPVLLGHISSLFLRWLSGLAFLAFLVVIVFHFTLVIDRFREGVRSVLPPSAAPHVMSLASQIGHLLGQYLRGLVTTAFTVGAFTTAGLGIVSLVFGIRHWLLIGPLAGILYVVPWVGGAVAQALAVFFGYTTATSSAGWAALAAWAVVAVVNQLGDTILMPRIVGRRVGLHPLAVLFGLLAGWRLFGIAGLMLAAPLMASAKIVLAHWLPVRGAPPTERAPHEPLDLDLGAIARNIYDLSRRWGQRIEKLLIGHEGQRASGTHPGQSQHHQQQERNNADA